MPARGTASTSSRPSAVRAWFAISLQTFGGPAGQIAVMQRTLVDENAGSVKTPIPPRPLVLHAAARPRSPAAGHLHRLAAQRCARSLAAGTLFVLPGVVALLRSQRPTSRPVTRS